MSNGTNPGEQIYDISKGPPVAPYPTFTDGYQPTAYQTINSYIAEKLHNSQYTDLRAAYVSPLTFPPNTLLTYVIDAPMPSGLDESQQADWNTVQNQLETEATEISSLYNYWTQIQINTNSLSTELNGRFGKASNVLNSGSANGTLSWLTIFSMILNLNPDTSAIGVMMGMYFRAASQLSNTASGSMGALQDQLANLLETITSEAIDIYEPIALDWGKLQQFYTVVASASTNLVDSDLKGAGDQYETGIYQAVIPSIMAIVYFAQADWGQCGQNGYALGYTPLHTGQEGYNGDLCDRFSQIGVNLSDVINRSGAWSNLPTWQCVSTRFGTSCRKTG